ncbi:hypothetical protein CTAYLR_001639 [Chrysophaeum taylorii]|uniref:TRUD domain-containing protein n=1 Tax=Chrysophaeum taylorii TaxID=2483200 RepID=A0AAD7XL33_9STRA|nr:hypothetical protein CTAYLR_001639 [Chrysophaeum taylorii]
MTHRSDDDEVLLTSSDGRESKRLKVCPDGFEYMIVFDSLPYATSRCEGLGGRVKERCEDFVVTEVLDVAEDEIRYRDNFHWWFRLRRRGETTREAQTAIQKRLGLGDFRDVGVSGLKDKIAVATQWFSVPGCSVSEEAVRGLEPLEMCRKRCKLRRGTHAANRFEILLRGCEKDMEKANDIARRLGEVGAPNYFGEQRFGRGAKTAIRGARLVSGEKKLRLKNPDHAFAVDAFSSMLFNVWLARQVVGNGTAEDGPLFGNRLEPRPDEAEVLPQNLILGRFPFPGSRRKARVWPRNMEIQEVPEGLRFVFDLEPGAYATSIMREFVKCPAFENHHQVEEEAETTRRTK